MGFVLDFFFIFRIERIRLYEVIEFAVICFSGYRKFINGELRFGVL